MVSFIIIFTILYLIIKEWKDFRSLNYYKLIVFLSSIAIAISSHESVYFNLVDHYNIKPFDVIVQFFNKLNI